jgi:hypothetical protein
VDSHPELKPWIVSPQKPGSNNLRGLAAAANALQTEHAPRESIAMSKSTSGATATEIPPVDDVSLASPIPTSAATLHTSMDRCTDTDTRLLSRCVIKSIGPEGWRQIRNADDWYSVLREKAFAVWADGICNVLVELVDQSAVAA